MTAPFRVVLNIPCLPDLDLSANRRRSRHYMAQARDTATERERAQVMLRGMRDASLPERFPLAFHWTLYFPKGTRAWDADGCADSLKPWIDAMKDLGWITNDSPKYVPTVSYTSVPSSPKGPAMMLVIEQAEKEYAMATFDVMKEFEILNTYLELNLKPLQCKNEELQAILLRLVQAVAHPSICPGCKNGSCGTVGIVHATDCPMVAAQALVAEKEAGV